MGDILFDRSLSRQIGEWDLALHWAQMEEKVTGGGGMRQLSRIVALCDIQFGVSLSTPPPPNHQHQILNKGEEKWSNLDEDGSLLDHSFNAFQTL